MVSALAPHVDYCSDFEMLIFCLIYPGKICFVTLLELAMLKEIRVKIITAFQCDQMMHKKLPNFNQYWPERRQIIFYMKVVLFK